MSSRHVWESFRGSSPVWHTRLVQTLEVLGSDRKVLWPLRVLENGRGGRARPGPRVLGVRHAMSRDANEATEADEAAYAHEATHFTHPLAMFAEGVRPGQA